MTISSSLNLLQLLQLVFTTLSGIDVVIIVLLHVLVYLVQIRALITTLVNCNVTYLVHVLHTLIL